MLSKKALHIDLQPFTNDTRVIKECQSLINKLGMEIHVMALHKEGLLQEEIMTGINVRRFKFKSLIRTLPLKFLDCYMQMVAYGKKVSPDIVHAHDVEALPIAIAVAKHANIPLVYDAHEYETERTGLRKGSLKHRVYSFIEKRYIYRANAVITVSNSIAEEYVKLYGIAKPTLLFNCPAKLGTINNKSSQYRQLFDIPEDHMIFVYEGSFGPGRGIRLLLEAFARINNPKVDLIIMGLGLLEEEIVKYANAHANIHFKSLVPQDETIAWISGADIGLSIIEPVSLSYEMSLPNKFFEYCFAGLPVLASNGIEMGPVIDEYLIGWKIDEITVDGIIKAIEKCVIEKERINDFRNNLPRFIDDFNWEKQEEKLILMYDRLLNNRQQ